MESKAIEIGERLQAEAPRLIDYPTIETRTQELGYATSTRTLRFYVSEGILPAPRKLGKTPVFLEDEILGLLFVVHLMKSRFGRSLSEVRRVLRGHRGDSASLADKCALLYEEVVDRDRLQRVETEWLIDAFFRSLTGELDLYPKSRRNEPGERRPDEILITELVEDLEIEAQWKKDGSGEWTWHSPEAVLTQSRKKEPLMAISSVWQASRKGGGARVTPLSPPEDAITIATARQREELFLDRFDQNLTRITKIYSPLEKRYHAVRAGSIDPEIVDPYQSVAGILKALGKFDRTLLECLPHDRATRYGFPTGGLFGKRKPRLVVAAIARSPIEQFARTGGALGRLGRESLLDAIHEQTRDRETYYVLGVLSTVGWDTSVFDKPPRGENYSVVVVDPIETGGCRLNDSLPKKLQDVRGVFDPEEFGEKVSRTFYQILEHGELSIPGGHVEVAPFLESTGINREVLNAALEQVEQEDSRIKLTTVAGREILKRDRY